MNDRPTPLTDAEVKLVGMLGEHLVGVGLSKRLERENAQMREAAQCILELWDRKDGHLLSHFNRVGTCAIESLRESLKPLKP